MRIVRVALLALAVLAAVAAPTLAQTRPAAATRKVRVTGIVRDDANAISLPGIPVEVTGGETVYTDVDGRYVLDLVPGAHELKVSMDGYEAAHHCRERGHRHAAGRRQHRTVDGSLRRDRHGRRRSRHRLPSPRRLRPSSSSVRTRR